MNSYDNDGKLASVVWATPNAEPMIAYIARVTSENQENPEYIRLFRYLIKHGHWSPFEHASICVEINTSRAVAAQILRHRSFSFQEFSQRYRDVTQKPLFPEQRLAAKTNRQGSIDVEDPSKLTPEQKDALNMANFSLDWVWGSYRNLILNGFAPETARMILPMCSGTRIYMTGNVRSWIHYLELRLADDTQKEHRTVAQAILKELESVIPNIIKMMDWGKHDEQREKDKSVSVESNCCVNESGDEGR